jgi:hypothetical protein
MHTLRRLFARPFILEAGKLTALCKHVAALICAQTGCAMPFAMQPASYERDCLPTGCERHDYDAIAATGGIPSPGLA